jgi:hypothetical protein
MSPNYSSVLILLILLCFSCSEKSQDDLAKSDILIQTGTICGWCTLNDTLTINGSIVSYVNYNNCAASVPSVEKSGKLEPTELKNLLDELDITEFNKLDLNSCNICFDGCDDWITLKDGTNTHTIRFSRNDSKLLPFRNFIDQLIEIKGRYSNAK